MSRSFLKGKNIVMLRYKETYRKKNKSNKNSNKIITSNCKLCNEEFKHYRTQKRTYCSRRCSRIGAGLQNKMATKRATIFCRICNKEIRHRVKVKRVYCSKVCKDRGRKLYYKHSLEAKRKMRDARKGKSSWNKGKHLSRKHKENISNSNKGKKLTSIHKQRIRKSLINHHVYLKENSTRTIKLPRANHRKLHARAYDYLYYRYGKRGLDNYLKWFDKKYSLYKRIIKC